VSVRKSRGRSNWGREKSLQKPEFRPWQVRFILNRDHGICHVCGEPGADQADHVIPLAEGGAHHTDNGAPIHGSPCHETKTREEAARGYARHRAQLRLPPEPSPFDVQETYHAGYPETQ